MCSTKKILIKKNVFERKISKNLDVFDNFLSPSLEIWICSTIYISLFRKSDMFDRADWDS